MACASPSLSTPFGFRPKPTSGGCGCGGGCSGTCNGFMDTRGRDEPCCNSEPQVEVTNYLADPGGCPDGSVPAIVIEAKKNPFFASLFGCFEDKALFDFLCCMGQYNVPGCGDMPVLLAAAHFYTLLTTGQRLGTNAMVKQAEKGKPLEMVVLQSKTMSGDAHWALSMYGLMYLNTFKKPAVAYMGMAWGI